MSISLRGGVTDMTRLGFICRNMSHKRTRSLLLIACITIAFFTYFVLASFENGFQDGLTDEERLVVSNKTSDAQPLPISYYDKILNLPGVAQATYMARSRATYRTPTNFLGLTAVEPRSFPGFISDQYDIPGDAIDRFRQVRNGVLVGRSIASQEGWTVGQRITLTTSSFFKTDGTADFEFEIIGIFDGKKSADTHFAIARYDYINAERSFDKDTVSNFGIVAKDEVRTGDVIGAVDRLFANSAYETRTMTEAAFMKAFVAQFADIATIVQLVAGVAFVTVLMIVANTMFFALRERTREIGVLKVLGFSRLFILCSVLAETIALFAAGLSLGLGLAMAAMTLLQEPLSAIVPSLSLTPGIVFTGIGFALLLAFLTGSAPALNAMRITPAAALKER